MQRKNLLIVTAIGEAVTGISLLIYPAVVCSILLGVDYIPPETTLVSRIAGAAIVAIGVACWLARNDGNSSSQHGLTIGIAIYDVFASALLAYAGLILGMVGLALWPAVVIHSSLAVWSVISLRAAPLGRQ